MVPQTPGVYIIEKNAFPNSVVEVATAVPVFIGHTERATYNDRDLTMKPTRVTSMADFETYFGGGAIISFKLKETLDDADEALIVAPIKIQLWDNTTPYLLPESTLYYLYNSIRLFYQNGGATCYIISVGKYDITKPSTKDDFMDAIDSLVHEPEPTMIVCPDAFRLTEPDYYSVAQHMLTHCGETMSRIALLDVYKGAVTTPGIKIDESIENFRTNIGQNNLNYGVCYFPWLETNIVSVNDINSHYFNPALLKKLTDEPVNAESVGATDIRNRKTYVSITKAIARYINTLPASAAMAGVYTSVDTNRGVWKAPANVSLNAVIAPTVSLNDNDQENLNVDAITGKSINAIRPFTGLGVLVWGARTLDGNSQDWRYINVRRTMIMIEQSVKLAARSYVFEPNDSGTWTLMNSMISSFLFNLWKQGALAGTKPDDAYQVSIGLGSTMTADDILNGIMNITILVAIVRPAEFIMLTFQQQMQKS